MSTVRAKTHARGGKEAGRDVSRVRLHPRPGKYAYVIEGDQPTHVLIPVKEFDRLRRAADVQALVAKLQNPDEKWVDADEFGLQLAGNRILAARKARHLTQKQLADRLSVPQSQISRIERNPDRTTVRTLKRIARALGVDVSALVT